MILSLKTLAWKVFNRLSALLCRPQLLSASCALILSIAYAHPPEGVWKKKLTWKEDWVQVWKTVKKEAWETKWKKVSVPIWKEVQVSRRKPGKKDPCIEKSVHAIGARLEGGTSARLENSQEAQN